MFTATTPGPYHRRLLISCALAGLLAAGSLSVALAGPANQAEARSGQSQGAQTQPDATPRLPQPVSITRELELGGGKLRYVTTAGSTPLRDSAGAVQAEVAWLAYMRETDAGVDAGEQVSKRPITFVFNGGPGAASAWLNFGALGPRILSFGNEGNTPADPVALRDNPESWLAFTDLVFIDPPGTGFSRIADKDEVRRKYWSVDGDIDGLVHVIGRYLVEHGRMTSPKFVVGESYGGFRAPKVAHRLQSSGGVGVNGVIMLSPVLDFGRMGSWTGRNLRYAALLPSMAAARLEREGAFGPEALREVEEYARGEMVSDLLRGPQNKEAMQRLVTRVSQLTGLDPVLVKARGGRIDADTFTREFRGPGGKSVSAYDAGVSGLIAWPFDPDQKPSDPILDAAGAALSSAAVDEITRVIGWKPDGQYELLGMNVNRNWRWGGGRDMPQAISAVQDAAALNPKMKALVAHGYTDLVTPYFESLLDLASLPPLDGKPAADLRVYPGGHMFYTRDSSRKAFLKDVRALYSEALDSAGAQSKAVPGGQEPRRGAGGDEGPAKTKRD